MFKTPRAKRNFSIISPISVVFFRMVLNEFIAGKSKNLLNGLLNLNDTLPKKYHFCKTYIYHRNQKYQQKKTKIKKTSHISE